MTPTHTELAEKLTDAVKKHRKSLKTNLDAGPPLGLPEDEWQPEWYHASIEQCDWFLAQIKTLENSTTAQGGKKE